MSNDKKILDDMSKIAGSMMQNAFSSAADFKQQCEAMVHSKVQELVAASDLITREEFDVVRDMAAKARAENEILKQRLALLEEKLTQKKK